MLASTLVAGSRTGMADFPWFGAAGIQDRSQYWDAGAGAAARGGRSCPPKSSRTAIIRTRRVTTHAPTRRPLFGAPWDHKEITHDHEFGRRVRPTGLLTGDARVSTLEEYQPLYSLLGNILAGVKSIES